MLIRGAEVEGRLVDVRVDEERVDELGEGLDPQGDEVVEARGGALIPGLVDHHIHLLAVAAALASVDCGPPEVRDAPALRDALRRADADAHGWVRGVGYIESVAGELDAAALDRLDDRRPVRVQHRSGALWMLNSRAAELVGLQSADHPGVERDHTGRATGRVWRADDWLGERLPRGDAPDLDSVGRRLSGYGITTATDATPRLAAGARDALLAAVEDGTLAQDVVALGWPLDPAAPPSQGGRLRPGPWKIVLADSGLPDFDELCAEISAAHRLGRPVAVHCVTREALALLLAALDTCGVLPGDRLEHAALVPPDVIPGLRSRGLTVVTQPGFLAHRGDDYTRDVPGRDLPDLYRCASLQAAHVPVGLSSDAPYGPLDPWAVMSAAVTRRTPAGVVLGPAERMTPAAALSSYLSPSDDPGGRPRRVVRGAAADLVLLHAPLEQALLELEADLVRLTFVRGRLVET